MKVVHTNGIETTTITYAYLYGFESVVQEQGSWKLWRPHKFQ